MGTRHSFGKIPGSKVHNSTRININLSSPRCKIGVEAGSVAIGNLSQKGTGGENGLIRKSGLPLSTLRFGMSYQMNSKRDKSSTTPPRTRSIGDKTQKVTSI